MWIGFDYIFAAPQELLASFTTDEYVDSTAKEALLSTHGEQLSNNEMGLSALAEVINFFYTQPRENGKITLQSLVDLYTDAFFATPAVSLARTLAQVKSAIRQKSPRSPLGGTYLYLFDHYAAAKKNYPVKGVHHGGDITYYFDPLPEVILRDRFTAEDVAVSELFVSMLTDFAKTDAPWGRVSGKDLTVSGGTASFYGYPSIPYALPPVGERRFAKPQPHPGPGEGRVFDASSLGFICPQLMGEFLRGAPHSVMVWIHGGYFTSGDAGFYTPGQLVTEGDVIVVVIQYRLGILGFLSTGDGVSPGNYGLFDQNMAIRWVKDNIRAFGGDPDSITIFGESAGSASVGYHVLSPKSRELFSRAILQSGSPLSSWSLNREPRKGLYMLAQGTGCLNPGEAEPPQWVQWYSWYVDPMFLQYWVNKLHVRIVECLRGVSVDTMLPYTNVPYEDFVSEAFAEVPFVPVIDRDFVPRDPAQLALDPDYLSANGVTGLDVMFGVNNNEGKVLTGLAGIFEAPEEFIARLMTDEFIQFLVKLEMTFNYGELLSGDEAALSALAELASFFYTQPRQNDKIELQV
ncbi:hypothetical protein BaRGS_00032218 [Batillaria attramentaria]|uniref:Carboxylic ester hydrolase n=1 Tax=Batillaria attramentaria TaxID=370345 RepID=A0ABD0JP11_9CAEN